MEYRGEQHGIYLGRFLNRERQAGSAISAEDSAMPQLLTHAVRPPTLATVRRVQELMELMRRALAADAPTQSRDATWKALQRRWGQYRFRVFAIPPRGFSGGLAPFYYPIGVSADEAGAIFSLFELSRNGQVDRLRRCVWCSKWFFARFAHQTHCPGGDCRKKEIGQSPKWKEYRKGKSKDYYWRKKLEGAL